MCTYLCITRSLNSIIKVQFSIFQSELNLFTGFSFHYLFFIYNFIFTLHKYSIINRFLISFKLAMRQAHKMNLQTCTLINLWNQNLFICSFLTSFAYHLMRFSLFSYSSNAPVPKTRHPIFIQYIDKIAEQHLHRNLLVSLVFYIVLY